MLTKKKTYMLLVVSAALFWSLLVAMVVFVDPENMADFPVEGLFIVPAFLVFICLFLLFRMISLGVAEGLLWSVCSLIFLYSRLMGIRGWWNGVLLLGIAVCGQIYLILQKQGVENRE